MSRFIGHLIPIPSRPGPRLLHRMRGLAIVSILALLLGSFAPCWALAAEPDSEAEGAAPPGLEEPDFEPGGEETVLESLPDVIESSGGTEESAPIETEPAEEPQLPEAPEPPLSSATAEAPASEVPAGAPPPASAPAAVDGPAYDTAPAAPPPPTAPDYEAAPSQSSAPVENQPIVAPPTNSAEPPAKGGGPTPPPEVATPEAVAPEASPPAAPSEEEEASTTPDPVPAAVPPDPGSAGPSRSLAGRSAYTVRPGDCLWSIAAALLPRGASNAEIVAEVARLWRHNAERIGTGDPNVILVGTVLALG